MSGSTVVDGHSELSLRSTNSEREAREEAMVGDVEAQRENSVDEKITPVQSDPFLVVWNGPEDPENPLNFTTRRKVGLMAMVAAIAFLTYPPVHSH
jgi:hypothetical protein